MKKLILLIILIIGGYFGYLSIKDRFTESPPKFIYEDLLTKVGENKVHVNSFTIYGKYLNLKGELPSEDGTYELVFKNNEEELVMKSFSDTFSTSEYINDGINLEKLKTSDYIMLLHNKTNDTYYNLINDTEYHNNEYYTITRNDTNNLITFKEDTYANYNYWVISIKEDELPNELYDIVIDPGHGGIDTGAGNGKYNESKFNLEYAKALKEALEEEGLKVKLTRDTDERIDFYGEKSRTGIPYEVKAKLMLSLHLNSSNSKGQHGVEIYRAYEDNNTFAKLLADNIVNSVNTIYSINPMNKIIDGVYMRTYSKEDIASIKKEAKRDGFEPYEIGDNVTYYYFIREVGGIMTKAFSDGRNPKYKENIYRNYNQAAESYLCELAYISNNSDLNLIINNKDKYVNALKMSILSYAEIVKES